MRDSLSTLMRASKTLYAFAIFIGTKDSTCSTACLNCLPRLSECLFCLSLSFLPDLFRWRSGSGSGSGSDFLDCVDIVDIRFTFDGRGGRGGDIFLSFLLSLFLILPLLSLLWLLSLSLLLLLLKLSNSSTSPMALNPTDSRLFCFNALNMLRYLDSYSWCLVFPWIFWRVLAADRWNPALALKSSCFESDWLQQQFELKMYGWDERKQNQGISNTESKLGALTVSISIAEDKQPWWLVEFSFWGPQSLPKCWISIWRHLGE